MLHIIYWRLTSWEMIQIFHIQVVYEFCFSTKNWSVLNFPNVNENLLFEVIIVFCYLFFIFPYLHVCCGLSPWEKGFTSFSLLTFTKKLGRSSYDVTMTQCDVILILFFCTFVANAPDLQWNNFLLLTMNRTGVIRIICRGQKWPPPSGLARA